MTYREAIRYLESFIDYERLNAYDYKKSFKLERMQKLAGLLGDPQKEVRAIHIAGTKGKGSTAAIIYSILKAAGYRVGLYTSPHLISFRERIRINDEFISEGETCEFLERIRTVVDRIGAEKLSFFELYTALAYLYFKDKKADFAVYETGLGGRLDATNIIYPLVSAITPISYEHTQKLGTSLKEIAAEKSGIIKEGSICVSAPQDKEALDVIADTCNKKNSRLILVGRDILYEESAGDDRKQVFSVFGMSGEYPLLEMELLGAHQVANAATAVGIAEAIMSKGVKVTPDAIRMGIRDARWEGRLEVVRRKPFIILDGAQNRASAKVLADAVRKIFRYKRLILTMGISKDKDIKGIVDELLPLADSVILTKSKIIERACEPSRIKEYMPNNIDITTTSSVAEALDNAIAKASEEDLILITGSLFVVGEAKAQIGTDKNTDDRR